VRAKGSRGVWAWSLALIAIGVVLLLNNFLLLSGFNVTTLWPLLLVIVGAVILLRGDLLSGGDGRTFGITRGSVESATLEISAGEIDVHMRALEREGRLIAGQYAANSRPALSVQDTHTFLKMDRSATPWFSFANWEMALAQDLPWQILVSSSLGQVNLDLAGLIVQNGLISTGFGDIRFTSPEEALEPIYLRSTIGNITILVPPGINTRIYAQKGVFFRLHVDENRYEQPESGIYAARDTRHGAPAIEIYVSGTFGDAYLA
jgi:hypothetical protein